MVQGLRGRENFPDSDEEHEDDECWMGTTGYSMVLKDCVIMGSDRQKGNYSGSKTKLTEKTFSLDGVPVGYVRAGYEDDADALVELLKKCVREGCRDVAEMANYVFDNAGSVLPANHRGHLLIGGYNQGSSEGHLYHVFNGGVLDIMASENIKEIHGRFQVGSGKGGAFVRQNESYNFNMPEEEGITLFEETIWYAIKNDKHTGLGVEYVVIRRSGPPLEIRETLTI